SGERHHQSANKMPMKLTAFRAKGAASALGGLCWIAVLSSLNLSAQTALPDWVRARGLSVFLTVFFGAMSGGSLLWGQIASLWGVESALLIAAAGAAAMVPLTWAFKLNQGEGMDLAPSAHWPQPVVAEEVAADVEADRGPVMIQVVYRIAPENRSAFLSEMRLLRDARRRSGGYSWTLMQDAADPERHVETWFEASWLQHMRHHARVAGADKEVQERLRMLEKDGAPKVAHFVLATQKPSG
ncbi:MAG: MFS transporter, partial [Pseudomonadota bacterium]